MKGILLSKINRYKILKVRLIISLGMDEDLFQSCGLVTKMFKQC